MLRSLAEVGRISEGRSEQAADALGRALTAPGTALSSLSDFIVVAGFPLPSFPDGDPHEKPLDWKCSPEFSLLDWIEHDPVVNGCLKKRGNAAGVACFGIAGRNGCPDIQRKAVFTGTALCRPSGGGGKVFLASCPAFAE